MSAEPHDTDAFADAVKAIDVPEFVEDYIDAFRAICRRDPDRGGGHRERGKAADALRDAIRRAIYDAEQSTLNAREARIAAVLAAVDDIDERIRSDGSALCLSEIGPLLDAARALRRTT